MNLPNKLTISRMCLIPVFIAVFYLDVIPCNYLIAAVVFAVAALTDMLDGYIARSRNLVTNFGKFLDPVADKVLVASAFIVMLTRPQIFEISVFEGWGTTVAGIFVAVILARELIISGFRMVAAERKIVIAADKMGKIKTTCQDVAIVLMLSSMSFLETETGKIFAYIGLVFFAACVFFTVISGVNYLVKNRRVLCED